MEKKEEVAMSLPADLSLLQGLGGAEGEAALATLEKQLICPICLELFNKPVVILPCQHNLCRKCANELYQPSLFQARTTMMLSSGRFRCPSCRHEVVLDRHGVYGLQRNLLVENIIDVYKQEVSNYKNKAASLLPPPSDPAQLMCSDHEGEKVNIYCLTCKVPTCSLCKVFGAHQSCQVAPLTDIYQLQKDELNEEVNSLRTYNDKVQALIDDLEQACRNIEENARIQKQRVCEQFDRVTSILDERRKAMTQQISSEQEEKTGHAQAVMCCYGDKVAANNKLMEQAVGSMEEPDMVAFVQNSRELVKKVISASSSFPNETLKPGYETLSNYMFNFSRQERALRSIDFPKVEEDVLEETEAEPESEELIETSETYHHRETSIHSQDPTVEEEENLLLISPLVEQAQTATLTSAADPQRDSEEATEAVLQTETDLLELNNGRSDTMMKSEEEMEEEGEKVHKANCVQERDVCEQQEGMTTLQCEVGEAEGNAGDLSEKRDTKETQDTEDKEEDREEQTEEGDGVLHNLSYVPALHFYNEDQTISFENQAVGLITESKIQAFQIGEQSFSKPKPNNPEAVLILRLTKQEITGPVEREEDMKSLVCLHGAGNISFSLDEGTSAPTEGALDKLLDDNVSESSRAKEEILSGNDKEAPEQEKLDERDRLEDLKCASELEEREFGGDDFKSESMCERRTFPLQRKDGFNPAKDRVDEEDQDPESTDLRIHRDGDAEMDVGSSGFSQREDENGKNRERSEEFKAMKLDVDSLQAITLLFYLLAFLVILQRVWAYIGVLICI